MNTTDIWTVERVHALGVTTTLATAAAVLQISRSQAYRLADTDTFPAPLIRADTRVVVPVAGLLLLLGAPLDRSGESSVDATTTQPADYAHRRWRRRAEHPGDDA